MAARRVFILRTDTCHIRSASRPRWPHLVSPVMASLTAVMACHARQASVASCIRRLVAVCHSDTRVRTLCLRRAAEDPRLVPSLPEPHHLSAHPLGVHRVDASDEDDDGDDDDDDDDIVMGEEDGPAGAAEGEDEDDSDDSDDASDADSDGDDGFAAL